MYTIFENLYKKAYCGSSEGYLWNLWTEPGSFPMFSYLSDKLR